MGADCYRLLAIEGETAMRKLFMVVAFAFACNANAQQLDGTWTGTVG